MVETGTGTGTGTRTWRSGDPRHSSGHLSVVRSPDAADIAGWQATCACGWHGPVRGEVPGPEDVTTAVHAPPVLQQVLRREWATHAGADLTARVRAAVADVDGANARLRVAVGRARAAGASWAQIGDALGVTRQSAHERWAGTDQGGDRHDGVGVSA